jgi:hypothetical protein
MNNLEQQFGISKIEDGTEIGLVFVFSKTITTEFHDDELGKLVGDVTVSDILSSHPEMDKFRRFFELCYVDPVEREYIIKYTQVDAKTDIRNLITLARLADMPVINIARIDAAAMKEIAKLADSHKAAERLMAHFFETFHYLPDTFFARLMQQVAPQSGSDNKGKPKIPVHLRSIHRNLRDYLIKETPMLFYEAQNCYDGMRVFSQSEFNLLTAKL